MKNSREVCVIGAGTAGICAARHSLASGMKTTVFEQTGSVGGTWVYTDSIGKDEFGMDVHSSMYKGLHTNLPKEIMGYPDFPIPKQEKSYIPAEDMLKFLTSYADTFGVTNTVNFYHHVIRIRPYKGKWEIIVKDLRKDVVKTEFFDYVVICNGHYHTPAYANFEGIENFRGRSVHSHDYRDASPFKNETVLVIGAGPSGMDLAHEVSKVADKVILSHHLPEKPKTVFKDNVIQKPDPVGIRDGNYVEFSDGTQEYCNVILHCVGYKYSFPFLSVDCGIAVDENYVNPLYKHCISIKYPTMAFIGLPFYVCASQMMDLQTRFVFTYFSGRKELPSKVEMQADTDAEMEQRWSKGLKKRQAHMMGPEQVGLLFFFFNIWLVVFFPKTS